VLGNLLLLHDLTEGGTVTRAVLAHDACAQRAKTFTSVIRVTHDSRRTIATESGPGATPTAASPQALNTPRSHRCVRRVERRARTYQLS
jgi:hypothetical protein